MTVPAGAVQFVYYTKSLCLIKRHDGLVWPCVTSRYIFLHPGSHTNPTGVKDVAVHANHRYLFDEAMDILCSIVNAQFSNFLNCLQGVNSGVG